MYGGSGEPEVGNMFDPCRAAAFRRRKMNTKTAAIIAGSNTRNTTPTAIRIINRELR